MERVVEKFLKYININTQSVEDADRFPSSDGQWILARELVNELQQLGLKDASVDEFGYVMATLPSNVDKDVPTIGLIAHMDTSPDACGNNIKPNIIKNYDGKEIVLNKEENIILSPQEFPELKDYIGETLITTNGKTLLGADDKAGIAEIMTAIECLNNNPDILHGTIKIAFNPDEEVSRGTEHFDVRKFNADFAYTVDGGAIGEIEYENFNAAKAKIEIKGINIHAGYAKNKMINSILIGTELANALPEKETPSHTEGYEGFYHLMSFEGTVDVSKLTYIIRDFEAEGLERRKQEMESIVKELNGKYGDGTVAIEIKDQYSNMKEKLKDCMHIIDIAKSAMEEVGVKPVIKPIRGGTDGAELSYMGLPTPNLFAGGHNFHGIYEFVPVRSMQKCVEVILKILEISSNE